MSTAIEIAKAFNSAVHDLHRLGECKKMLVSPQLLVGFRDLLVEQSPGIPVLEGVIYFRGLPVVACVQLEDLEYSFVK